MGLMRPKRPWRRTLHDIQILLTAWARWVNLQSIDIGYPHQSPFVRLSRISGWSTRLPPLNDDMGIAVDQAVARLRKRCKGSRGDFRYTVLVRHYLGHQSDSHIARKLRIDRRQVATARTAAESWVDSHLSPE